METSSVALIEQLVQAVGPSGYEHEVGRIIRQQVTPFGVVDTDAIGNIVCEIPGTDADGPRYVFAAHQDEIGFMVSDILENGFLRFVPIGGWNTRTLPSSPVDIINELDEVVPGVIGQIPPHFLPKGDSGSVPEMDELFIDIGAKDSRMVREKYSIGIGSIVVPHGRFHFDARNHTMMGKAFDDRIGVAALIELGRRVHEHPVGATVLLAFTVQEEVGIRGAKVLSNHVVADAACIVEGAPADDVPGGPANPQTCMGKGAHVRIFDPTHIGNIGLLKSIRSIVSDEGITIQEAVRKGGGTDAREIALAGRGIPTVVTGVPVRYAHSNIGMISLKDFEQLVGLLFAVCRNRYSQLV
jgi:endoglucanase